MDKEELLRRAQYDHRKGDERERQLEMKVLHETNAMIALFFFVLWLAVWFRRDHWHDHAIQCHVSRCLAAFGVIRHHEHAHDPAEMREITSLSGNMTIQ